MDKCNCQHSRMVRWEARPSDEKGPYYALTCGVCGKPTGSESYIPSTTGWFYMNTGESSGEPCPGQPGDSPPRAAIL